MSKKGAFIYQQIELTTAEWMENTTIYPESVWLFERLENGKFNMKFADGVHTFAELPAVMQSIHVSVKQNDTENYILTFITAEGEFDTPNLKGEKGDKGDIGDKGEKGDTGDTGETGPQGAPGADAPVSSIDPETKHWMIGEEDTGIVAEGKDGISVTVEENSGNTDKIYRLDVTDNNGKKTTPNLRGKDGEKYVVPTLDHKPAEEDLSWSDGETEKDFDIGYMCRWFDPEKENYVFYQLYDIADGKAVWKEAGSGGGMVLTEKLNITLSSNQAQPDSTLNGLVVHVKYGDNDTSLIWNGAIMTAEIPMNMTYTIEYPNLEGYSSPESEEYIALAGNTRQVEASYNATVLTINIDNNQIDKSDLNNVKITVLGSLSKTLDYSGSPLVIKVPTGRQLAITPSQLDGYATVAEVIKTPVASAESVSFLYQTELLTLMLVADNGVSCSGQKVTIGGTEYTYVNLIVRKIPYGTSYSIYVDEKRGFTSPSPVGPLTASQVSREVTMTYQEIKVNTIHIDQTIADPDTKISGDINGDIIQWIRQNSHRVLAKKTSDGNTTYCRLKDDGGSKYHDGSTAQLNGNEGDVFMKPPRFFYKGTEGDQVYISFAKERIDDSYVEWDGNILIGVYEGYINGNKAYSRSGVASTGNVSQENWKQYAHNRGEGYQIVDWQMHCVMGCLYYALYGNTNCQSEIGVGTNSYTKDTGQTDALGMEDTKASTNGNNQSINFWGLENWWGNKYEWLYDYVNPANQLTATVNDPVNGGTRPLPITNFNGWYVKKMKFGKYLDLINTEADSERATDSTYYCDYQWWPGSASSNPRSLLRSCHYSYTHGGVACADASYASSNTYTGYGSRLAFRGVCREAESVEAFKSLPVL